MFLFSETLNAFRSRLEKMATRIAEKEMGVCIRDGCAFFPRSATVMAFPKLALFEDGKRLGFFDPSYPMIGVSRLLCHDAKTKVIGDVLRHELAHWMSGHLDRKSRGAHGRSFRAVCRRYGWGPDVFSSTVDLQAANAKIQGDLRSEALIARVQKLLELARSDNPHESQLATLRANQLMLKHHLGFVQEKASPLAFMDVVLKAKRVDAKFRAIARILRSFLVYPVINRVARQVVWLEVTGPDKTSVVLATYIAAFLDCELDRLWQNTRKSKGLSGNRAKANFMLGVADGYLKKQRKICQDEPSQTALCKVDDHLNAQVKLVYPHLRQSTFRLSREDLALKAGTDAGTDLCIRKPVDSAPDTKRLPSR